jgi:hypothetical protein
LRRGERDDKRSDALAAASGNTAMLEGADSRSKCNVFSQERGDLED